MQGRKSSNECWNMKEEGLHTLQSSGLYREHEQQQLQNCHLFQQIPPVMFPDVDVLQMMNDNQPVHFLSDCPTYVSDERIKF